MIGDVIRYLRQRNVSHRDGKFRIETGSARLSAMTKHVHDKGEYQMQRCGTVYKRPYLRWHVHTMKFNSSIENDNHTSISMNTIVSRSVSRINVNQQTTFE